MKPDTAQIYFPAEDTHLLIRAVLREVQKSDCVLEVGTGSGAVAKAVMAVAPRTAATEINPHAALYAATKGVAVVRGNLLDPITGEFDLILFNAPYLPTSPEERMDDWLEFALDGGPTGRDVIEWFLPAAIDHLAAFGRILLLVSSSTGVPELLALCKQHKMIAMVADSEQMEDGEILYVLRISRDLCCRKENSTENRKDKSSATQCFDMTTQKIEFGVSGMHCGGCSGHLTTMLSELPGVTEVKVDHAAGTASLSIDSEKTTFEDITECVLDAGFAVVSGSLKHL